MIPERKYKFLKNASPRPDKIKNPPEPYLYAPAGFINKIYVPYLLTTSHNDFTFTTGFTAPRSLFSKLTRFSTPGCKSK
jgi:hypothetical protein